MNSSVLGRTIQGVLRKNTSISAQVTSFRFVSAGDLRARTTPGHSAKLPSEVHKEEKPVIKRLINESETHAKETPSFKGPEEVIHGAYDDGEHKGRDTHDGSVIRSTMKATGSQSTSEKDPLGKRKFSTLAGGYLRTSKLRTFSTDVAHFREADPRTGSKGSKPDRDVDYDHPKTGNKSSQVKSPIGQVVGKEGVESVDGGKHQESSDVGANVKNKEKHKWNVTSTGSSTV